MKKNILDIALLEVGTYIDTLDIAETCKNLTKTYISKHNRGQFVNFTYNSLDAFGLFKHLGAYYGFEINEPINPNFNRDIKLKFSRLKQKFEEEVKSCRYKKTQYKKIKEAHIQFAEQLNLDTQIHESNVNDDIMQHFYTDNVLGFSSSILNLEMNRLIEKEKKLSRMIQVVNKMESRIPYADRALKQVEKEYLKLVLNKYFSTIETHARVLFNTNEVYVLYNEKELVESYFKGNEYSNSKDVSISGFSRVQNKMLSFIHNRMMNFNLMIHDKDYSYTLSHKIVNTRLRYVSNDDFESNQKKWTKKLSDFRLKNPKFNAMVELYNQITGTFGKDETSASLLVSYLYEKFDMEIINQYNFITQELRKLNQEKQIYKPKIEDFPTIVDAFPEIQFTINKERDLTYWIALKEERYTDVLCSISNEEYELQLHEPISKETEERIFGKK